MKGYPSSGQQLCHPTFAWQTRPQGVARSKLAQAQADFHIQTLSSPVSPSLHSLAQNGGWKKQPIPNTISSLATGLQVAVASPPTLPASSLLQTLC